MAFLSGIFGGNQQSQQRPGAQAPQQPGPQAQPNANGAANNPGAGNYSPPGMPNGQNPGAAAGAAGPASHQQGAPNSQQPLDQLMGLMTPKAPANGQGAAQPKEFSVFGQVDPNAIKQQIGSASFTNDIKPEQLQAAMGGDQAAFMDVLNTVARNAFQASLTMSQNFVEHGVKRGNEHVTGELDSHFRKYQLKNQNIDTDNPALQHPVGQAMVRSIAQQIANANPHMTADQVNRQALESVQEFLKVGGQPFYQQSPGQGGADGGKKDTNWLEYVQ